MKLQFAILWVFVLLLSLVLVALLLFGLRQRQGAPLPERVIAEAPRGLAAVATRPPSTLIPVPTSTALPTSTPTLVPTMTPYVLTVPAPMPRNALASNSQSQYKLANYCSGFGSPVSLRVFDWQSGSAVGLTDETIASIPLGWDASDSIWRGYGAARPFDQPEDTYERWRINLFLPNGRQRWVIVLESPQTPDVDYVYAFSTTIPFAAADGSHFGIHPCRAFVQPKTEMSAFLTTIEQYQEVVRYPSLISAGDPRWVRGTAYPLSADPRAKPSVELRTIPSTAYNDPIATIDQVADVWFVLDPSWGRWAQIRYGSLQGWVDTQFIELIPAE